MVVVHTVRRPGIGGGGGLETGRVCFEARDDFAVVSRQRRTPGIRGAVSARPAMRVATRRKCPEAVEEAGEEEKKACEVAGSAACISNNRSSPGS